MIIAINGLIGSGKDTVAGIMCSRHGFTKISMANHLKDAVSSIFGWERRLLEGDTEESRKFRETPCEYWSNKLGNPTTPRQILQLFGNNSREIVSEEIWLYSLFKDLSPSGNYVLPDLRYPNEADTFRNCGGKVIKIIRGENPQWYQTAMNDNSGIDKGGMARLYPWVHVSEWALAGYKFDYTIENGGTIEDLENEVEKLIGSVNS